MTPGHLLAILAVAAMFGVGAGILAAYAAVAAANAWVRREARRQHPAGKG